MRTDLNLVTNTTDGTKKTNKLSYVNPDANEGTLSTLAQKVANLSNDTLTAINKTDTTDIPTNATPIRVTFYGNPNQVIYEEDVANINNERLITLCCYSNDSTEEEQTELPIMKENLMPYIKENNTRVQPTIYKDTQDSTADAYAQVGLAITPNSGTNDKEEMEGVVPKYTGDIVIGTKILNGNYINMAPDLIIRIVRE